MSDQNVKFKTSTAPTISEKSEDKNDSYKKGEAEKPQLGPGNSKYQTGNVKTSQWKQVKAGGTPKSMMISDFPDENSTALGGLADWATEVNDNFGNFTLPDESAYEPKNAVDFLRMQVESFDVTKQFDLKDNVPEIPTFAEIYSEIKDFDYINDFYNNRMGLITDLLKNTEAELENQQDPHILRTRMDFRSFLLKKKAFIERQMIESVHRENLISTKETESE